MKYLFALFVIAIFLIHGCAPKVDVEAEKEKVKAVIDQYAQVLETEDMELFSNIGAHDADMVSFVTNAAERWVGCASLKNAVQKQFDSFDHTKISVRDQVIHVNITSNTSWFSA
jgi:hypothetical protein